MKKLKIYLETSVINFLFAEDALEYQKITIELFDNIILNKKHNFVISKVVIDEILKTPDNTKLTKLLDVIQKYQIKSLTPDNNAILNIENLAEIYLKEKVIPKNKKNDALHIAYAVIMQCDLLLSWNFKHIANINKAEKVKLINLREGYYYPFNLLTPLEVDYEEEEE